MNSRILVVDDNNNNLRLLKDILEDENYDVITSASGIPVLEMVKNLKPALILLDIMMPEMDGFEVCRALKNDFDTKEIPVIMVTAKAEGKDLRNALEIGAIDYIKKPIDEMEVIARVASALRQEKQKEELQDKASRDGLTSLYNHALLIDLLDKELMKQDRNKEEITYVMLDIDFFKKTNDTYGHAAGDIVLKDLAGILVSNVRVGDIAGRYGGEEFGLVLPNISSGDSYNLCDRIRKNVEDHIFDIGSSSIHITISIGLCHRKSGDELTCTSMIKHADEALYRAKENGRNRVEAFV